MKLIKKYGYAIWLGAVLTLAGWTFTDWQFYIAIIPILFLVEWKCSYNNQS